MTRHNRSAAMLGTQLAALWVESAFVMGMRMALLATRSADAAEHRLMVEEKPQAFAHAGSRAMTAAMRALSARPYDPYGAYLDAASAYTRSVTGKVRRNRRRLAKG